MSNIGSYTNRSFSESQKFLVLDPSTGTTSLVLGSDLVNYITPQLNAVNAESTRLAAENTDYDVGEVIQTTGATSPGDNFAAVYLVVEGGTGDFPMINGNDLLVIRGDEFLREQLIQNTAGVGSDLVAHTGTSDTVTESLNNRLIRVSSRTEMKAYDVPVDYQFSLEEGGRSGLFVVKTGTPPSDPEEGVYVVLDNGNYAERIYGQALTYKLHLSVAWWGVTGVKGSNDLSNWNAMIAYINANGEVANGGGSSGFKVRIPSGNYSLSTGGLDEIQVDNVEFEGDSPLSTTFFLGTGTVFTFGNGPNLYIGGAIKNVRLVYEGVPDGTSVFCSLSKMSRFELSHINCKNVAKLLECGTSAANTASNITVNKINGTAYNVASSIFSLRHGAGFYWSESSLFVEGVPVPVGTDPHDAVAGRDVIAVSDGSWDTVEVNQVITNRFYRGLYVLMNTGEVISNFFFSNFIFDYCAVQGIRINGVGGAGTKFEFSNGYIAATDGNFVYISAPTGFLSGFTFTDIEGIESGDHGYRFDAGPVGVSLKDVKSIGNGRLATGDGVLMNGNSDWSISGGDFGIDGTSYGVSHQARYGIQVGAGCDSYKITGTSVDGATNDILLNAHSSGSFSRSVLANRRKDGGKLSYISTTSGAIPASPATFDNNSGLNKTFYIRSGTVSNISIDGLTVHNETNKTIDIGPGQSMTITYSVAPTVVTQVKN